MKVHIVGGGFAGLGAAYELGKRGIASVVYEASDSVGGLAGTFDVGGTQLEKFYHHWFNNDTTALGLVKELGLEQFLVRKNSNTGSYYANRIHRLSGPLDVLKFKPLPLADRVRLGKLALKARKVKDWEALERITAEEWLISLGGKRVYDVVWKPLLVGKFGEWADQVAAVWIWNKLQLRGGSRGKGQKEELYYLSGGFQRLTDALVQRIKEQGGEIRTGTPVEKVFCEGGQARSLRVADGPEYRAENILVTLPPEQALQVLDGIPLELEQQLNSIPYLAAQCVVLELNRSLSSTYWMNVNDMQAPFVGVIEHTNFEQTSSYGGRHIIYLGKYLPRTHRHYTMPEDAVMDEYIAYLSLMFPEFDRTWVENAHLWRAPYAQPVVLKNYRDRIPPMQTEVEGLWLCNMAQIYPEDRGTNYALRSGFQVAGGIAAAMAGERQPVAA